MINIEAFIFFNLPDPPGIWNTLNERVLLFLWQYCYLHKSNRTHKASFQCDFINRDFDWNVLSERDIPRLWMSAKPEGMKIGFEADKSPLEK